MIVVDASVAVKWFVVEVDHEAALALLESGAGLTAPDLIVAETMHVLRKKLRVGDITEEQYLRAGGDLPSYLDELVPSASVIDQAARMSILLDHGFYDCVYLALAATSGAPLVTADEVFRTKTAHAALSVRTFGLNDVALAKSQGWGA